MAKIKYIDIIGNAGNSASYLTLMGTEAEPKGIKLAVPETPKATASQKDWMTYATVTLPGATNAQIYLVQNGLQCLDDTNEYRHSGGAGKRSATDKTDAELIAEFSQDIANLTLASQLDGFTAILRLPSNKRNLQAIAGSVRRCVKDGKVLTLDTLNREVQRVKRTAGDKKAEPATASASA